MRNQSVFIVPLACLALASLSCVKEPVTRTEFALGTVCSITLFDSASNRTFDAAFSRIRDIESSMSAHLPDSDIASLNKAAGKEAVAVSKDTAEVLSFALTVAARSDGAFDPTIGPVVQAWGIGTERETIPSPQLLAALLPLVDHTRVSLSATERLAYLETEGMGLDLGAIAKGFAADEVAKTLRSRGVSRAIIDLGGNILVIGNKAKGKNWVVGIKDPETALGEPIASVSLADQSVVTSGTYERFFERDGKRYHHIIDPKTGFPKQSGLLSVTIVSPYSMTADALSTAVFVLGAKKGVELVAQHPQTNVILVGQNRLIYASEGIRDRVSLISKDYTMTTELSQLPNDEGAYLSAAQSFSQR